MESVFIEYLNDSKFDKEYAKVLVSWFNNPSMMVTKFDGHFINNKEELKKVVLSLIFIIKKATKVFPGIRQDALAILKSKLMEDNLIERRLVLNNKEYQEFIKSVFIFKRWFFPPETESDFIKLLLDSELMNKSFTENETILSLKTNFWTDIQTKFLRDKIVKKKELEEDMINLWINCYPQFKDRHGVNNKATKLLSEFLLKNNNLEIFIESFLISHSNLAEGYTLKLELINLFNTTLGYAKSHKGIGSDKIPNELILDSHKFFNLISTKESKQGEPNPKFDEFKKFFLLKFENARITSQYNFEYLQIKTNADL